MGIYDLLRFTYLYPNNAFVTRVEYLGTKQCFAFSVVTDTSTKSWQFGGNNTIEENRNNLYEAYKYASEVLPHAR